jgi:hypothetical protein
MEIPISTSEIANFRDEILAFQEISENNRASQWARQGGRHILRNRFGRRAGAGPLDDGWGPWEETAKKEDGSCAPSVFLLISLAGSPHAIMTSST